MDFDSLEGTPVSAPRFIYKKIAVAITSALTFIDHPSFTLDKNIKSVHAISLTTDNETKVFNLQHRLEINGQEILPQEFEARMLYAYASVPNNDRFFNIGNILAGNGVVKIKCFDKSASGFVAYNVNFYLKCEVL